MMNPWIALAMVAGVLLVIVVVDSVRFNHRRRSLFELARTFEMRYSPVDRFQLQPRAEACLLAQAGAQVEVRDVMYCSTPEGYLYCFTVQFVTGTFTRHERIHQVWCASERAGRCSTQFASVTIAPAGGEVVGQYRALLSDVRALTESVDRPEAQARDESAQPGGV